MGHGSGKVVVEKWKSGQSSSAFVCSDAGACAGLRCMPGLVGPYPPGTPAGFVLRQKKQRQDKRDFSNFVQNFGKRCNIFQVWQSLDHCRVYVRKTHLICKHLLIILRPTVDNKHTTTSPTIRLSCRCTKERSSNRNYYSYVL